MSEQPIRSRTVTWRDPAGFVAGAEGKSGLELLQMVNSGEIPAAPMGELIGMDRWQVEEGKITVFATPGEHLYNLIGTVHGGFAAVLLDTAMGCAVHSTLPAGVLYATLEYRVNLIRPMTAETGEVRAVGEVIEVGRRTATARGEVHSVETGKLLAHGTTTCLIMGPSPSPAPTTGSSEPQPEPK
jgi:uncharacterized protein (TIGR00369 family)